MAIQSPVYEQMPAFDRAAVEDRLQRLWPQSPDRVRWLAARHALRSFLLLPLINQPLAELKTPSRHFLSLYYAAKLSMDRAVAGLTGELSDDLQSRVEQYLNGARIVREQLRSTDLPLLYGIAYAADAAIVLSGADASEGSFPYFGVALQKGFDETEPDHPRLIDSELKSDPNTIFQAWINAFHQDLDWIESHEDADVQNAASLMSELEDIGWLEALEALFTALQETDDTDETAVYKRILDDYAHWLQPSVNDPPEPSTQPSSQMSSETRRSTEDHLGRAPLVKGLASILGRRENTHHTTIGLFGHWGSGKTRVLDLLKRELSLPPADSEYAQADFLFAEFNAWEYEHAKNIQAAMAHVVITSLMQPPGQYRRQLKQQLGVQTTTLTDRLHGVWEWLTTRLRVTLGFVLRKHPLQTLSLIVLILFALFSADRIVTELMANETLDLMAKALGFSLPVVLLAIGKNLRTVMSRPFTKELMTYIKLPSYAAHIGLVPEMQEDIHKMVDASLTGDRRLLLIVDDLDRCDPDGIVKTFEAIRLVMTLDKVSIVIAIDQRIALAALAHKYKSLAEHHELKDPRSIAHDYLGKMIHLPITLDIPMGEERLKYLQYIWQDSDELADVWKTPARQWTVSKPTNVPATKTKTPEPRPIDGFAPDAQPSTEELSNWIQSLPVTESGDASTPPEIVYGLNTTQKAAFAYWSRHFELANPRLLKRLNNSYNLIRLVSGVEDRPLQNNHITEHAFAIILTLMLLEFINGQEHASIRNDMRNTILNNASLPSLLDKKNIKSILAFLDDWCRQHEAFADRKTFIRFADQFVLPAIATDEPDND